MANLEQNQLVADLARDIVVQTAPQEIPLFRATSTAYFKNPDASLKSARGKDEMLGFGAGEVIVMMTPTVLVVMTQVVQFLTAEVQKAVTAESSNLVDDLVKKMFKKFQDGKEKKDQGELVMLTHEQLMHVRKLAYEEANRLIRSDAKAQLLANAIVGSLATSSK